MGLFGSVIEARVRQILRNRFGREPSIDFIGDGQFFCDNLQFSIRPFYAAVNDDGIFFIHDANIVLILTWQSILRCERSKSNPSSLDLLISIDQISNTAQPTEYPFCYWHDAKLNFKNPVIRENFIDKYVKMKRLKSGLSGRPIDLHDRWADFRLSLPVTKDNFIKSNSHLGDEDKILEAYYAWGRFNDALRILFYTGRNACLGNVPGQLIPDVIELLKSRMRTYTEIFGKYGEFDEKTTDLFNETSKLSFRGQKTIEGGWAIGELHIQEHEWQSDLQGIPVHARLSIVNFDGDPMDPQVLSIWNDYVEGAQVRIDNGLGYISNDGSSTIATNLGLVTISEAQMGKLGQLNLNLKKN